MIEMTIQGGAELERKLAGLEKKVARKSVKQALRAGAKIVLGKTKAVAPIGGSNMGLSRIKRRVGKSKTTIAHKTGYMKQALVVRAGKKNRPGTYAILQVFDTQRFPDLVVKSKNGKRAFYPAAVEYGHASPGKAGGAKTTPPHSFIIKGFKQSVGQAETAILQKLKTGIEQAWKEA